MTLGRKTAAFVGAGVALGLALDFLSPFGMIFFGGDGQADIDPGWLDTLIRLGAAIYFVLCAPFVSNFDIPRHVVPYLAGGGWALLGFLIAWALHRSPERQLRR